MGRQQAIRGQKEWPLVKKEKNCRARNKIRTITGALPSGKRERERGYYIRNEFLGIIGKGGLGIRYFLVKEIEVGMQRTNKKV